MKKILFLCVCLFLLSLFEEVNAQDIILKRDGEELKVKVLEISLSQIIFRYSDSLQGPFYSIMMSDVFMIKYANGNKELMIEEPNPVYGRSTTVQSYNGQGLIEKKSSRYYKNGVNLSQDSVFGLLRAAKNANALMELNAARSYEQAGTALIISGIFLSSMGMFIHLVGTGTLPTTNSSSSFNISDEKNLVTVGTAGIVAGVLGIASGSLIKRQSKIHIANAIRLYNDDIKK